MKKIQRQHIKKDTEYFYICDFICSITNEIRNECIRLITKHYDIYNNYNISSAPYGSYPLNSGVIYNSASLFQILKDTDFMFRGIITSKVVKKVLIGVEKEFKGYFKSIKEYYKNISKFKNKPQKPNFHSKNSRYVATFEYECISTTLNSGYISIGGKNFFIDIPNIHNLQNTEINGEKIREIKEVKIIPSRNGYELQVVYEKIDIKKPKKVDNKKYFGIDTGILSLLTITSNHLGWTPTMISGSILKKIISDYEYKLKYYRNKLKKEDVTSKRIQNMLYNRNNKILDICHKLSRKIVNLSLDNDISKIVIGNNKFWKQETYLGKKTKLFQKIPYNTIISMINYKCFDERIDVVEREESYTSKSSFLDMEPIKKQETYLGKREGKTFISYKFGKIDSDINGSLNILRKELGNNIFDIHNITKYKKCPKYLDLKLN